MIPTGFLWTLHMPKQSRRWSNSIVNIYNKLTMSLTPPATSWFIPTSRMSSFAIVLMTRGTNIYLHLGTVSRSLNASSKISKMNARVVINMYESAFNSQHLHISSCHV